MANHASIAGIVLALVGCRAATSDAQVVAAPRIETRLTYVDDASAPRWRVELVGEGLRGTTPPVLELQNRGEWLRIDDYYLRELVAEPPLRRREKRNAFEVLAPDDWDRELRVRYELPVVDVTANARETFGLLPWRTPTYSFGFAANTLFAIDTSDEFPTPERSIEITAPADWLIASGFAAPALGRLRARVPESFGNTAIAFGRPLARAAVLAEGVPIRVVQFDGERAIVEPLADFGRRYLEACIRSLGAPRSPELSLIVTEPGFGGTRTDGVIAIGCPDGFGGAESSGGEASPWTLHFLAHELFHDWLGGRLKSTEGEQLAWFWEGFTDYLSLWHLTPLCLYFG
ncbi:MAG: hypothetical protein HZA52_11835 [Planctomycetes bacterium]|nr:hypothetical protein [Planctomycetota bacterium]